MPSLSVRATVAQCLGVTWPSSLRWDVFGLRRTDVSLRLAEQLSYIDKKGTLPHPFMARACNSMHEDSAATDVSTERGLPSARSASWRYFKYTDREPRTKLAMIPTITVDSRGRILCLGAKGNAR
jgi:hypothetical protein